MSGLGVMRQLLQTTAVQLLTTRNQQSHSTPGAVQDVLLVCSQYIDMILVARGTLKVQSLPWSNKSQVQSVQVL